MTAIILMWSRSITFKICFCQLVHGDLAALATMNVPLHYFNGKMHVATHTQAPEKAPKSRKLRSTVC